MEAKTFRNLAAIGMTALGMITATALAGTDPDPLAGNRLAKTKTHKVIQSHIDHITVHEQRIRELKHSIRENRKVWKEDEMQRDLWLLQKERADLKRDKAYLRTDKQAYLWEHKQVIKAARVQRDKRQAEWREAKCNLRKDIRKGNTAQLEQRTEYVAILERAIVADQAKLDALRNDYHDYVAYLNDELRDAGNEDLAATSEQMEWGIVL